MERVRQNFHIEKGQTYAFSDSTITLAWIKGPVEKAKIFIRNRHNVINAILPLQHWHYVKTTENPADLATRGLSADQFRENEGFWKQGPSWIINDFKSNIESINVKNEAPDSDQVLVVNTKRNDFEEITARFSNYRKMLRTFVYISRFLKSLKGKGPNSATPTSSELEDARLMIIKQLQSIYFPYLEKDPLRSLRAFKDPQGLIRVGGRLENSNYSYDKKHPIILHRKCYFLRLYVNFLHMKYYHAGFSFLVNYVQGKFWTIGGISRLVKRVLHECVWCTRIKAQTKSQIMGDLPKSHTEINRPFSTTGVDYAGPFELRCTKHRSIKYNKSYLAFFVCFSTKFVHVEVVTDLTTEAFCNAFDRFIAQRNVPKVIYSDNATNFVGFKNLIVNSNLTNYATSSEFEWRFIPARSPHQGGLWESAVKAGKALIQKAVGLQVLNLDEMYTVAKCVEAILNSRPLCTLKTGDTECFLTPAHLVMGSSLSDSPLASESNIKFSQRYKLTRQIINSFWTEWRNNYLNELQHRNKWQ